MTQLNSIESLYLIFCPYKGNAPIRAASCATLYEPGESFYARTERLSHAVAGERHDETSFESVHVREHGEELILATETEQRQRMRPVRYLVSGHRSVELHHVGGVPARRVLTDEGALVSAVTGLVEQDA